jgi:hypothetical protein
MELEELNEKPSVLNYSVDTFFGLMFIAAFGFVGWMIFSSAQTSMAIDAAPFQKVTVSITSKDGDEKLSIRSNELPKGGDVIGVNQYTYGAVTIGDRICVRFKNIPDVPDGQQYGTEFVSLGSCPS